MGADSGDEIEIKKQSQPRPQDLLLVQNGGQKNHKFTTSPLFVLRTSANCILMTGSVVYKGFCEYDNGGF